MKLASLLKWIDAYNLNAIRTNTAYLVDAAYAASRSDDALLGKMDGVLSQQEFSNELLAKSLSIAMQEHGELHGISKVLENISASLDAAVQQMRGRNQREERAEALKELLYVMGRYQEKVIESADWDEGELDDALHGLVPSDYEKRVRKCIADGPAATITEIQTAFAKEFSRPMRINEALKYFEMSPPQYEFNLAMATWIRKRLRIPTKEAFELEAKTLSDAMAPATSEAVSDDDDPARAPHREDYPVPREETPERLKDWALHHPALPEATEWTPEELAADQPRCTETSLRFDTAIDLLKEKSTVFERAFGFRILLRTIESNKFTTRDLSSIDDKRYFDAEVEAASRAVQGLPPSTTEVLDRLEKEYALYQEVLAADITEDLPEVRAMRSEKAEDLRAAARIRHNIVFHNTDEEVELVVLAVNPATN